MQHIIRVVGVVPDAIPGMFSVKLEYPEDDEDTHIMIPVSPYAAPSECRGFMQSNLIVVISGGFNLIEICFPHRVELEGDIILQHCIACFIGEEAVHQFLNDRTISRLFITDEHKNVWAAAYTAGVQNIEAWRAVLGSVNGRSLSRL